MCRGEEGKKTKEKKKLLDIASVGCLICRRKRKTRSPPLPPPAGVVLELS